MDYLEYLYVREEMIFKINNIFETLIKNELKRRFLPYILHRTQRSLRPLIPRLRSGRKRQVKIPEQLLIQK